METQPTIKPFERFPEEPKELNQWVNWIHKDDTKIPINPNTLGNAGSNWPNTWTTFDRAVEQGMRRNMGLAFVLTEADPYTVIDLDHVVGKGGQIDDRTRFILDLMSCYVELSPSNTGLHLWIKNEQPINRRTVGLEVYSYGRFMTCTARANPQAPTEIPDRTAELQELLDMFFPKEEARREFTPSPVSLEDDEIWQRLFNSKSGHFFHSLFSGDTSVCYGDHSRAVIMLANQLAAMTDCNPAQMERMLRQTGLYSEKWDSRRGNVSWLEYQINDAIRYVSSRGRR